MSEQRCGWTGAPCACERFPWKEIGRLPERCLTNGEASPAVVEHRRQTK